MEVGVVSDGARHLEREPARWPVVVIGVLKMVKVVILVGLGVGLHYVIAPEWHERVVEYVNMVRADPHNGWLHWVLEKVLMVSPGTLKFLRVGFFAYAVLYGVEGIGLLLDKKWAEWMVVISTAGFLPLEGYEMWRHVTWVRGVVMGMNVVVLVYLVWRLRRMRAGGEASGGKSRRIRE